MGLAADGGDVAAVLGWMAATRRSDVSTGKISRWRSGHVRARRRVHFAECGQQTKQHYSAQGTISLTIVVIRGRHSPSFQTLASFNHQSATLHFYAMQESAQPSTANVAAACAILAGVTGYFIGTAKSLGLFGGSPISEPAPQRKSEKAQQPEAESSDEEDDDTAPAEFPGHTEECKMVLVVRTDLGMTKGMYTTLKDCRAQCRLTIR